VKLVLFHAEAPLEVEIDGSGAERAVRIGDGATRASLITLGASSGAVSVDGRPARFLFERVGSRVRVAVGGECFEFDAGGGAKSKRAASGHGNPETRAPMPGKVLQVIVEPGAEVAAGDSLLILEAMKMENVLTAEIAGTVKEVHAKPGDMVEPGKLLVLLTPKA
jgi:3-methylcrotonyl-CoA carboxylase alpha subunit